MSSAALVINHSDATVINQGVAQHPLASAVPLPSTRPVSQQYVRDFTAVAKKSGRVEDLVNSMLELHGERDQPDTLWISARAEVARHGVNQQDRPDV